MPALLRLGIWSDSRMRLDIQSVQVPLAHIFAGVLVLSRLYSFAWGGTPLQLSLSLSFRKPAMPRSSGRSQTLSGGEGSRCLLLRKSFQALRNTWSTVSAPQESLLMISWTCCRSYLKGEQVAKSLRKYPKLPQVQSLCIF